MWHRDKLIYMVSIKNLLSKKYNVACSVKIVIDILQSVLKTLKIYFTKPIKRFPATFNSPVKQDWGVLILRTLNFLWHRDKLIYMVSIKNLLSKKYNVIMLHVLLKLLLIYFKAYWKHLKSISQNLSKDFLQLLKWVWWPLFGILQ